MAWIDDIKRVALLELPWNELNGCNILVTGASGLIGSCLVDVLMNRPNEKFHVFASGRNEKRLKSLFAKYEKNSNFSILLHDVTTPLVSDIDFNVIIDTASSASPQLYSTDPVGVMKSNILGVDNLLSYGTTHKLKYFLYVSSGEIYGEGDGFEFREDCSGYVNCATVRACYPSSKRAAETLCVSYAHQFGVDVRIVRPCHVYGPGFTETDKRVYAQFIRNVLNDEDIVLKSDGSQFRSWCYVIDCVAAMLFVLLKGKNGEAYNIADATSNICIKQLAEMIASIGGKKVIFDIPDVIEKLGYNVVTKSIFSVEKLETLGWKVSGDMFDKIKCTISEALMRKRRVIDN